MLATKLLIAIDDKGELFVRRAKIDLLRSDYEKELPFDPDVILEVTTADYATRMHTTRLRKQTRWVEF